MPRKVILAGFGLSQHKDWKARIGPLKPPGNYKKQETIAAWVEEQWSEIEKDPLSHPLGAKLNWVYTKVGSVERQVSPKDFVAELCEAYAKQEQTVVVGYNLYAKLQVLVLQLLEQQLPVPFWILQGDSDNVIQFRNVTPVISKVDEAQLFRVINVEPLNLGTAATPEERAKAECLFVEKLATRMMYTV